MELLYSDPVQRLVADCALMDCDTAVVSDRRGNISVLSCPSSLEGMLCSCDDVGQHLYSGFSFSIYNFGYYVLKSSITSANVYQRVAVCLPACGQCYSDLFDASSGNYCS